VTTVAIRLAKL